MTAADALTQLKGLAQKDDPEAAHGQADVILCAFLVSLGYQDIVNAYEAIAKWYA
jgi:hypothetical protein